MIIHIEIDGFKTFKDFKVENVPLELLPSSSANNRATFIEMGEHLRAINGPKYLPIGEPIVTVYREDQFLGNTLQYCARDLPRTVLSLVMGIDYLPISIVREEMRSCRRTKLREKCLPCARQTDILSRKRA